MGVPPINGQVTVGSTVSQHEVNITYTHSTNAHGSQLQAFTELQQCSHNW